MSKTDDEQTWINPSPPEEQEVIEVTLSAHEQKRLAGTIYRVLEKHDASPDVLAIFGSLFDTLPLSDVLSIADDWIQSGTIIHEPGDFH